MRVNIETKNKETVAFVEGSINSANSKEFADALAAFPGEAESITLDIAGLDGNRWGEEMRNRALCLLHERLIPFVDKEEAFHA